MQARANNAGFCSSTTLAGRCCSSIKSLSDRLDLQSLAESRPLMLGEGLFDYLFLSRARLIQEGNFMSLLTVEYQKDSACMLQVQNTSNARPRLLVACGLCFQHRCASLRHDHNPMNHASSPRPLICQNSFACGRDIPLEEFQSCDFVEGHCSSQVAALICWIP